MAGKWKDIVRAVAPVVGTVLGGPLVGTAVKVLGEKLLGNKDATEDDIQKAVESGLPPEAIIKLKEIDAEFKLQMEQAGLDLKRLEAETEQAYLANVQDARRSNAGDRGTFWMGVVILVIFFTIMSAVSWGAFRILGKQLQVDPSTSAVVFTMIGTIVGYVAAMAQTVVNFVFGSSRGSSKKSDDMAAAVQALSKAK